MVEISSIELRELRDNRSLLIGEIYHINDYSGSLNIYMTAVDEGTLGDESVTDDINISLHYNLDSEVVDYMKDITRNIEGYFDWTNNVEGECSDIYFENAKELNVKDSNNIVCENSVVGSVSDSSNIIIGDGATVQINNSSDVVVGRNSSVTITGSTSITIGERNVLTLTEKTAVSVADDNENIVLGDYTKIGSRNRNVNINGENNTIKNDNYNLTVNGDLNEISESRFVEISGSFNDVEKTDLLKMTTAVGNKVFESSSVDVVNTNNNSVSVRDIIIQDKPAFIEYFSHKNSDIKRVKNLVNNVNMQSDNEARVLIIDEEKFYQETGASGTKGNVKYDLVEGRWTEVKN